MKNILSLNFKKAKQFFLKNENYFNVDLPPYIKFDKLLSEIDKKINNSNFSDFCINCKDKHPKNFNNVNYTLLHNKNGRYDWRPFELIHPVLYVSLVNNITHYNNWKQIKKRLGTIRGKSLVKCMSLPIVSETKQSDKAEQILNWWEQIEQKSIELSLEFNYIYHTDISNCYGSIYTHSIAWAIHSKKRAKQKNKKDKNLIGNIIDNHIQAMSYGQTNGIPQGSILMDFITEIVLNYADLLLSKKIKHINKNDFEILRYRDDYRIFTNNPIIAEEIIKNLTETLIELGLKLHTQKTTNYNNIIQGSIKQDKIDWLISSKKTSTIQKRLLVLHTFSNKHSNSGTLVKELQNILKKIKKQTKTDKQVEYFVKKENILVLISIVVDIAYHNPRTYPISIAILSVLFDLLNDSEKINIISKKIMNKFQSIPNTGYMQIWLQRILIKINNGDLNFNENICKIVNNDKTINLWNNEWLHSSLVKIIQENKIIDIDILNNIDSVIKDDEILLFKQYEGI